MKTRYAGRQDIRTILRFIRELAEYEHMPDEVVADEKTLEEWIFDKPSWVNDCIAKDMGPDCL